MFYVWAVTDAAGIPVIEAIESDLKSAVARFLRTRPPGDGSGLEWLDWEALGYRCERFELSRDSGRER